MPTRRTWSRRRRGVVAIGLALLVAGCVQSQTASPSEGPTSLEPSSSAEASETMSASAFPSGEATSFIGQHLRGPRAPVLAAVEELGYTCGPEEPNPPDLPRIRCAGPDGDSTVIIIAAEDDFRGIGLTTHEMARMDEFFAALGSDAISDDLIDSFEGLIELAAAPDSLCPIPCESVETGKNLGNIEARLGVYEGLLLVGVLQEIDF